MDNEILYRLHANCPHLTELDLSYNTLNFSNIKMLTELLKKNTNLTSLNLEGNNITDKSAFLIRDMLNINTSLKKLNLSKTLIQDEGSRSLGKIINNRPSLEISLIKNFILTGCYKDTLYHTIK